MWAVWGAVVVRRRESIETWNPGRVLSVHGLGEPAR